jgi:hypothetical protein
MLYFVFRLLTRIVGYFLLAREIQNQPNIYNMFSDWHNSVDLMIDNVNCQILIGGNHEDGSQCSCSKFHHHTFQGHTFFLPPEIPDKSESELLFSSKFEFLEANQRHLNVCNTFWRPSLSLNQQNYANRRTCYKYLVDFESLWPEENSLRSLLTDGET